MKLTNIFCNVSNKSNSNILDLNTIGFKAQSLWGRVQINLIKYRFLRGGENRSTRGKTPQSREEKNTQPTYDTKVGHGTRATLVRDECSHHNTTTAFPNLHLTT